jgi:hypothetical protein
VHEFSDERRQPIRLSLREPPFDHDIFVLRTTRIAQSLPECLDASGERGPQCSSNKSYPGNFVRLRLSGNTERK